MSRTHWFRLSAYFFCATLLVLAVRQLDHLFAAASMTKQLVLPSGHKFPVKLVSDVLVALTVIIAAMACEFVLDYRRGSSFARVFRDTSTRNDFIATLVANVPYVLFWLSVVFTFGLSLAFNGWIGLWIPRDWNAFSRSVDAIGLVASTTAFVLVVTFFDYWRHRLLHTGVLFPVHRFHHSATTLTGFSAFRSHPAEAILRPLFSTLPLSLLGAPTGFILMFNALILFHGLIVHGDKGLSWGWVGRNVLCDPLNHRIHHSSDPRHFNKNLCAVTPIWDKLFGTYCYDETSFELGVADSREIYAKKNFFYILIVDFVAFLGNFTKIFEEAPPEAVGAKAD